MTKFTFTMTEDQARMIFKLVSSEMSAYKNWTAGAVERDDLERAKGLVKELRAHEKLFAAFNIDAKYAIAESNNEDVKTKVEVRTF